MMTPKFRDKRNNISKWVIRTSRSEEDYQEKEIIDVVVVWRNVFRHYCTELIFETPKHCLVGSLTICYSISHEDYGVSTQGCLPSWRHSHFKYGCRCSKLTKWVFKANACKGPIARAKRQSCGGTQSCCCQPMQPMQRQQPQCVCMPGKLFTYSAMLAMRGLVQQSNPCCPQQSQPQCVCMPGKSLNVWV